MSLLATVQSWMTALIWAGLLVASGAARAEAPPDPGRLFYTPAERAALERARARTPPHRATGDPRAGGAEASAPVRYDGVLIRSDGRTTHWIDGRPHPQPGDAAGLKPGQTRAAGRIYEPYQIVRPAPAAAPAGQPPAAGPPDRLPATAPGSGLDGRATTP